MDVFEFFLEYARMALGTAVGWLLEQLGFLFDWKAIKRRRDQLRDIIKNGIRPAIDKLGSPLKGAKVLADQIESLKGQIFAGLNTIHSTPADRVDFNTAAKEGSSFSALSFLSGVSLLPQLTWLMDKLQSALPRGKGDVGMPDIDGLEGMLGGFLSIAVKSSGVISSLFDDMVTLMDQWVVQGKLFDATALDPIIDFISKFVGRLIDMLKDLLEKGGEILEMLRINADKIIEWFDREIPAPGIFKGFYRGLRGRSLTSLDVACLMAAIPPVVNDYSNYAVQRSAPSPWIEAAERGADAMRTREYQRGAVGHFARASFVGSHHDNEMFPTAARGFAENPTSKHLAWRQLCLPALELLLTVSVRALVRP